MKIHDEKNFNDKTLVKNNRWTTKSRFLFLIKRNDEHANIHFSLFSTSIFFSMFDKSNDYINISELNNNEHSGWYEGKKWQKRHIKWKKTMFGKEIITEIVFSAYTCAKEHPHTFSPFRVFMLSSGYKSGDAVRLCSLSQHAKFLEFCQPNSNFECSFFPEI